MDKTKIYSLEEISNEFLKQLKDIMSSQIGFTWYVRQVNTINNPSNYHIIIALNDEMDTTRQIEIEIELYKEKLYLTESIENKSIRLNSVSVLMVSLNTISCRWFTRYELENISEIVSEMEQSKFNAYTLEVVENE